jgi:hypothetical protein
VTLGPVGRLTPFAPGGCSGERAAGWHHARMVFAVAKAIDGGFGLCPDMTPFGWLWFNALAFPSISYAEPPGKRWIPSGG